MCSLLVKANKYKRRPPMEWARGLWRAKYGDGGDRNEGPTGQLLYSLIVTSLLMRRIQAGAK